MRGIRWPDEMIARIVELRDVHRLKWSKIGELIGKPKTHCCTAYHKYKSKLRIAAKRRELGAVAQTAAPEPALCLVAAPETRPRYFHDADADIRARIARQGITAGFLGDPPPGRSALDQRGASK